MIFNEKCTAIKKKLFCVHQIKQIKKRKENKKVNFTCTFLGLPMERVPQSMLCWGTRSCPVG